jgi:hypothetical protein
MVSNFKKILFVGSLALLLGPMASWANSSGGHYGDNGYHPTNDGGNFGLGLEVGQPGGWGVSGKIWVDRANAFQPCVKFEDGGTAILQLDYLWHNFDIVQMSDTAGEMPLYIGLGGDVILGPTAEFAGRLPLGVSYIFDKRNLPLDIFLQAVPTLWFFSGGSSSLYVYGELGAHYYF